MLSLWQGSGQRHNRVADSHEGNLERFGLINLNHKVATLGFGYHLQ